MKKVIAATAILLWCVTVNAQKVWLDVGLKGGYNSTWLLNRNILDDKYMVTELIGAPFGGGKVGLNITEKHGIVAEFLYIPVNETFHTQLPSHPSNTQWTREIKLDYFAIPILYKCSKNGSYVEIGPQFSFLKGATDKFTSTPTSAMDHGTMDVKDQYQSSNISLAFGFGSYIFSMGDNLYITIGFRGAYGLADITGGTAKDQKYSPIVDNSKTSQGTAAPAAVTKSYQSTNTLTLGFHLELDFDLGYLAGAHCGRKQFLFFD